MRKKIIILFFLFASFFQSYSQCGLTITFSYVNPPINPDSIFVHAFINGLDSTCNGNYIILWDNSSTAPSTIIDTSKHFVCITDCLGCTQCDTIHIIPIIFEDSTAANINSPNNNSVGFNIYPNPTATNLYIECNFQNTEFRIIDILGKEIKPIKTENQKTCIDISELENGIYFIRNKNSTKKFIVLR